MDTQCNSIDIDNLRNFALGIGDLNDTQQSDLSPEAATLVNNEDQDQLMPSKQRSGHDRRDALSNPSSNSRPSKPPSNPSPALRLTASQPQLPSTVPDSNDARMAMAGIQSQGDTQPLSQGVQEEFTSKIREQQRMSASNATGLQDPSHTYQPGETGHIDFVTDFEQPSVNDDELNGQDEDIEPPSQVAEVRAEPYPESKRFREPKTPATAGRKRSRDGATISRENTTPRLPVNPFAGQMGQFEGMMNASQAFRATQFTSPLPNQAVTEGFSDRPSPNMYDPPRPSTADPTSTPARLPRSNMVRAVTEPQTTYVSMKESQAERERRLLLSAPPAQEDSDDDFGSDSSEFRRRRKRRREDLKTDMLFDKVTAKARPAPSRRGRGGRRAFVQRSSPPKQSGKAPAEAVLISDDPLAEGNVTEDETEHETDHSDSESTSIDELAEDNKENIGIKRVQVPMTASRMKAMRGMRTAPETSPSQSRIQKHPRSSDARDASDSREARITASIEIAEGASKATQTVAIVDSQPSHDRKSVNPANDKQQAIAIPQSSLEPRTVIPQSQPSQPAQSEQPEAINEAGVRARTPDVPASSTVQRATSGSSPTTRSVLAAAPLSDRTTNYNLEAFMNTKNAAIEHISSTPTQTSTKQRPDDDPSSNAISDKVSKAQKVVPELEKIRSSEDSAPTAATTARDKSGHTSNSTRSEEQQSARVLVAGTTSAANSTKMDDQLQVVSLATSIPPKSTNASSRPVIDPQASIASNSAASTVFHTAPTHVNGSPSKSRMTQISSQHTTPSPKKLRSRTIAEIAANPSPPDLIGSIDMDVDILTHDDVEFQSVVKGSSPVMPARKRRRGREAQVLQVADSEPTGPQPAAKLPAESSTAGEVLPSSPPPLSREQPSGNLRARSAAASSLASPPGRPIGERATGNYSSDSDPLGAGVLTATPDQVPPPSAVQASLRKRGRPKKAPKKPETSDEHEKIASEQAPPATNKALRIEVPRSSTDEGDGIGSSASGSVVAPNRVFAHFNGKNCAAYYSATCIGVLDGEQPNYRVRFDDGTVDTINGYAIKRLELRSGDHVKLDMGGARKNTYIVESVQNRQQPLLTPDPDTPTRHGPSTSSAAPNPSHTDIKGYANVVVSLKQNKPSGKDANETSITVPMKDVYLTQTMWTSFKDRSYTYHALRPQFVSRLQTPSERPSNPSTPSTRGRRNKASSTTHSRSTLNPNPTTLGIFANMAFAVTNISDTSLRSTLRHQISNNGGRVLAEGFDELFHIPALGSASPSKRAPKPETNTLFQLSNGGKETGFTCLIADKHCRMAKYIQALALGIPCVAPRWIQDCISKQRLVSWQPYLLAAGESTFLGGAVRSRQLPDFPPETTTLSNFIDARSKPLDGDSVLLIMEKGEEDKMKSHPLITHALGARKVSRATGMEAAVRAVEDAQISGETWDWVYSHDKEEKVEKALFGRGSGSKKRKRESTAAVAVQGKTRVVGNEFVIQSLILGQLVE